MERGVSGSKIDIKKSAATIGLAGICISALWCGVRNFIREERKQNLLEQSLSMNEDGILTPINDRFIPIDPSDEAALDSFRATFGNIRRMVVEPEHCTERSLILTLDALSDNQRFIKASYQGRFLGYGRTTEKLIANLDTSCALLATELGLSSSQTEGGKIFLGSMEDDGFTAQIDSFAYTMKRPSPQKIKLIGLALLKDVAPDLSVLSTLLTEERYRYAIPNQSDFTDWTQKINRNVL